MNLNYDLFKFINYLFELSFFIIHKFPKLKNPATVNC